MEKPEQKKGKRKNYEIALEILQKLYDEDAQNGLARTQLITKETNLITIERSLDLLELFHAIELKERTPRDKYPRVKITDIGRAILSGSIHLTTSLSLDNITKEEMKKLRRLLVTMASSDMLRNQEHLDTIHKNVEIFTQATANINKINAITTIHNTILQFKWYPLIQEYEEENKIFNKIAIYIEQNNLSNMKRR